MFAVLIQLQNVDRIRIYYTVVSFNSFKALKYLNLLMKNLEFKDSFLNNKIFYYESNIFYLKLQEYKQMTREKNITEIQGVPRNMIVDEQFEMSSSMIFKLFDTKETNKNQYMTVVLQ